MPRFTPSTPEWNGDDAIVGACVPPATSDRPSCPEVAFWRTVLLAALRDAHDPQYVSSRVERDREKQRARAWLLENMRDYVFVCMMAGIDPQALRRRAASLLN